MYQEPNACVYLVIPLDGMETYEKFENLFSFYPDGIHGVVRDYLKTLSDPEVLRSLEVDDLEYIPCAAGEVAPEQALFEKIIAKYENSVEYKSNLHSYPNCQMEVVVEMVCEMISQRVQEVVMEHHNYFKSFKCDFDKPKWLGQAMAVKATRIPMYH